MPIDEKLSFSLYQNVSGKIITSTNTFSARVTFHHLQYWSLQKTLGLCACHGISLSYFPSLSLPLPLLSSLSHSISFSFPSSPCSSHIFLVKMAVGQSLPVCFHTEDMGRTITCTKCYSTASIQEWKELCDG